MNFFPELIKAACSIVGVWGDATADGKVYHLRALDWDANSPAARRPSIVIYDSNEPGSSPIANIGFLGLIGSLTGISKSGISIGEKYMYPNGRAHYPLEPLTTYVGKPWMFVLRDTIQFAKNKHDVYNSLNGAKRTCRIHLGSASKEDKQFVMYDYAANFLTPIDDKNFTYFSDEHPQLSGVAYYDQNTQPSNDGCVGAILKAQHG